MKQTGQRWSSDWGKDIKETIKRKGILRVHGILKKQSNEGEFEIIQVKRILVVVK